MKNRYLAHHGVLGQKWGVRRYQNKDGSLTQKGKQHHDTNTGDSRNDRESKEKKKKKLHLTYQPKDRKEAAKLTAGRSISMAINSLQVDLIKDLLVENGILDSRYSTSTSQKLVKAGQDALESAIFDSVVYMKTGKMIMLNRR